MSLGASAASVASEWVCRSCMRLMVDFHTEDALTEGMTLEIDFNHDLEPYQSWYPVAQATNVDSNTIAFTFEADKERVFSTRKLQKILYYPNERIGPKVMSNLSLNSGILVLLTRLQWLTLDCVLRLLSLRVPLPRQPPVQLNQPQLALRLL